MKILGDHNYYVYITTNPNRTVLYVGVTNNLQTRMSQHVIEAGNKRTFAGRYHCYNLIYYEWYRDIKDAIKREKQIKGWRREKKELLIEKINPQWYFLPDPSSKDRMADFCGNMQEKD